MNLGENHTVHLPLQHTLWTNHVFRVVMNNLFILCVITASDSMATAQCPSAASTFNPCVSVEFEHPPDVVRAEMVAFAPIDGGACSDRVIQAMSTHFAENGVEVIDSDNVVRRLAEQGESLGTFLDQTRALEIGRILGPAVMLVVSEDRCDAEQSEYTRSEKRTTTQHITRTETARSGTSTARSGTSQVEAAQTKITEETTYEVPVYYRATKLFVGVSVQAIDLETGRIFKVQKLKRSHSDTNKSEDGYPEYPTEAAARDVAARILVHGMGQWFFPYPEKKSFVFFDTKSKHCNLKPASQFFKGLNFERALDLSVENARVCMSSPKKKIVSNAHYNLGVVYRVREEYDQALESFQYAAELNPKRSLIWDLISETKATALKRQELAEPEVLERTTLAISDKKIVTAAAEPIEKGLTNSDIIKLVQAKIPVKIVLQKISIATSCEFDLSVEALSGLVEAGVSEDVIMAMMEKNSQ